MILVALICVYAAVSGYWGVVVTDIAQALVLVIGLAAIVMVAASDGVQSAAYSATFPRTIREAADAIGWANLVSIVVFGLGWPLVTMDTWQRASASGSLAISSRGIKWSGGVMAAFALGWCFLGVYDHAAVLSNIPESLSQQHSQGFSPIADFFLIAEMANSPLVTIGLGALAASLLMAAMSTADTFLLVAGHALTADVLLMTRVKGFADIDPVDDEVYTNIARALIVVLGLAVLATWYALRSLGLLGNALSLFFVAYSVQYALLAPLLAVRRDRKPASTTTFMSISVSLVAVLWCGIWSAGVVGRGDLVSTVLGLRADQWLVLSPGVAWIAGYAVLVLARVQNGNKP